MVQFNKPPLADYLFKMMLLEAVKCYSNGDNLGLLWLEKIMFIMATRWEELNRRGK